MAARNGLQTTLGLERPEFVDPLAPDRKVGKVYVYRADEGWEVSGYYRRDEGDQWHAYLIALNSTLLTTNLKVKDAAFVLEARTNSQLEAVP